MDTSILSAPSIGNVGSGASRRRGLGPLLEKRVSGLRHSVDQGASGGSRGPDAQTTGVEGATAAVSSQKTGF